MANRCEICNKELSFGCNVSHSHKKTNRTFKPNIQKAKVEIGSTVKKINICTKCLKAGKVKKIV
ncbi:MAG: 50S ribosomal protein L28 [Actinobacteria bacterium]|nr:50S ribosomal protein L28 [Actinomycetota bacterium]MCL6087047.1 50S ribosomal protein L28 [Actinomycetota bacterium]